VLCTCTHNINLCYSTQIITTIGSYNALFYSFQSFVHPGDEVGVARGWARLIIFSTGGSD